jgi:hypothetical protein
MSPAIALGPVEPTGRRYSARDRLRLRLWVRLTRRRLDAQLAGGAHPDATRARALRARQITTPATLEMIAVSLRNVLDATEQGRAGHDSSSKAHAQVAVIDAREAILGLAERLCRVPSPEPRGVALALQLIHDPGSPLYCAESEPSLQQAVWEVADALGEVPGARARPAAHGPRVAVNVTAGGLPDLVRLEFSALTDGFTAARIASRFLGLERRAYGLERSGVPLDPRLSLQANGVRDDDYLQLIDPAQRDFGRCDIPRRRETRTTTPTATRTPRASREPVSAR